MWFILLYFLLACTTIIGCCYLYIVTHYKQIAERVMKYLNQPDNIIVRILSEIFGSKTGKITTPTAKVHNNERCISVRTYHSGGEYNFHIPYRKEYIPRHTNTKIILHINEEIEEIFHPPGFPFLCSARMLGGTGLSVVNLDDGETKAYHVDEIPTI